MGKKILAISTGLRANSNSETLLDSFIEGAKAAGNDVEQITLKGKVFAGGVTRARLQIIPRSNRLTNSV